MLTVKLWAISKTILLWIDGAKLLPQGERSGGPEARGAKWRAQHENTRSMRQTSQGFDHATFNLHRYASKIGTPFTDAALGQTPQQSAFNRFANVFGP